MPAKFKKYYRHGAGRQRGAVLMIMLVILVLGVAVALINSLSTSALNTARQETTLDALVQAREALLGYAVSDNNRPGELPCPDYNNDGMITLADYSGSNCQSLIGRLPWKTLGLPDLRDGSGEHLWYAVSNTFHASGSAILNSNTKGTLPVYNADGVTLQTKAGYDGVAVIFSPGSPLGTQARDTITQQKDAANYLDTANSMDNSSGSGPYIAGNKSDSFNDQLLLITTQDLIPLVEQRVAGVVKTALDGYKVDNNYYPWADTVPQYSDYDANDGITQGWLPENAATYGPGPNTPNWNTGAPPAWFFANKWNTLIFYSVANAYTANPTGGSLTVNGTIAIRILFIMPGTPIGTLTRSLNNLSDYFEDAENINGDIKFITPTSSAKDRDRLYWLPGSTVWKP